MLRRAATTAACILLSSCADNAPPAPSSLGLTLEPVGEFGCDECDTPALFGSIRGVAVGPENTVAVLTGDSPHGRLIDVSTGEVTAFAPEGEGPGELKSPFGIAHTSNGTLVMGGPRGSVFSDSGEFLATVPRVDEGPVLALHTTAAPSGARFMNVGLGGFPQPDVSLEVRNADATQLRLVAIPDDIWAEDEPHTPYTLGNAIADDGRVALGTGGGDYRIVMLDSRDSVIATAVRDIPHRERSPEEIAKLQEAYDNGPQIPGRDPPKAPTTFPHFGMSAFHFDEAGRLWVATNHGEARNTTFDIFSPELTYLGGIEMEGPIGFYDLRHGVLVAAVRGDLDIPKVRVWRIRETG